MDLISRLMLPPLATFYADVECSEGWEHAVLTWWSSTESGRIELPYCGRIAPYNERITSPRAVSVSHMERSLYFGR
jgi:hypothetical protein